MSDKPRKAYIVLVAVRAVDEVMVYADNAEEAKRLVREAKWEHSERLGDAPRGIRSVRRYPQEDREEEGHLDP